MAKQIANVVIATDSFAGWVGITNQMAYTFRTQALTANSAATGAGVTGNSYLVGIFNANTIGVGEELRGGTIDTSANLNITSNTIFTGATINATSNVNISTTNVSVTANVFTVSGGQATLSSNVYVNAANAFVNTATLTVQGGSVNVSSQVNVQNNVVVGGNSHTVAGNVAFDTSTLYVDATNNRVGILNTTPDAALTVTGSANVSSDFRVGGSATLAGTTHTIAGNVAFDTSTLFVDASNNRVGILNTTPDAALTVTGSANVSSNFRVGGNTTLAGTVHTIAGNVAFDTNTMFIDATNNRVGILNTTPDAALTVTGSANVSSNFRVGGTITAVGAATLSNTLSVTGTSSFSNTVSFKSLMVVDAVANTNIGANTTAAQLVYVFNKDTYKAAKITAKVRQAGTQNIQIQEILVATDNTANTSAQLTVYGVVTSTPGANLGVFTAAINTSNVELKFTQANANSDVVVIANLIP